MPRRRLMFLLTLALASALSLAAKLDGESSAPRRTAQMDEQSAIAKLPLFEQVATNLQVRPQTGRERPTLASRSRMDATLVTARSGDQVAVAITVDGRDVVAVASEGAAQAVMQEILTAHKERVLPEDVQIDELTFREKVDMRLKAVPPENVRTVEQAVNILRMGTDRAATYQVEPGDTSWDIAEKYSVSVEQLERVNPGTDLEELQIGQQLNVSFKEPYVHTRSVATRVVTEAMPFPEEVIPDPDRWPWQQVVLAWGEKGERVVTLKEHREDGQVVKTEEVESTVIKAPVTQVVKVGAKQAPSMGTGSLIFPVGGELSSYFGPRWGSFHEGIDIAAPYGTPIMAADSGQVVFRGWSGSYGNMIKIDHGGGSLVTMYAHLSSFNVSHGDSVAKGEVIGYVGNTGFSTGPHLHFEVHVDGDPINPLSYYE